MSARCSYAVFSERADAPPDTLLAAEGVPALDPAVWSVATVALTAESPLLDVLRTLAHEREPPVPKREFPTPHRYRQALQVEVTRADSLYPDALAFATGAVGALAQWAAGPVVDLGAERFWTPREWRRRFGRPARPAAFDAAAHIALHSTWAETGRTVTLHTHGMAKFAHPEFVALDVPDEGSRAAGQLLAHLATVRARTLEPLEPGHAFDPGFGQPMVCFVPIDPAHPVVDHIGGAPSVVTDYDVATGESVWGLYDLLAAAKALDRPTPAARRRTPLATC